MPKTQIQVPEELLRQLRALGNRRGWSLAETIRRGAELLLQIYPSSEVSAGTAWTLPTSKRAGWKGLDATQLREAAFTDADPRQA